MWTLRGSPQIIIMLLSLMILFLASNSVKGDAVILSQPLPVNASLDSPPAVFNCTCHYCSGQYWLINDLIHTGNTINKGVTTFGPTVFTNGSKLYTVTISTSIALNGSTIQCFVYNGSNPHIQSPIVNLLVQGLLSEVSHSSVTQINSTVLSLQYTAPFTLTGVQISHYNILILPTNRSVNITNTQYNVQSDDYCISYDISITPWNIVGSGNISTLSDIILYQAPVVTMPQLIEKYNNGTLQVYIEFQYNMSCKGTVPRSVSLTINKHGESNENKEYHCSLILSTTKNCTVTTQDTDNVKVTINITNILDYDTIYSISMSVDNTITTDFTFNISTYHVIAAAVLSTKNTTVCLECRFKQNSPSFGCYAVFYPTINTREFPLYYKIMKSPNDTIASDCISTVPNGVYSISILDALSYEEGLFNNTAINIPSMITIYRITTIMVVSSMSVTPASFVDGDISSSFSFSSPFPTNYNNPISSAGNGTTVLTITLSCVATAVMIIIMIVIINTAIIVGLCIIKRKKRNNKDGETIDYTASAINLNIKEYNTTLNEAYDTIGSVTHPTGRGTTGGLQVNVAYESISSISAYDVVQVVTEPTERIYDIINV